MAKRRPNRFMWDDDNPLVINSRCYLCIHKFKGHPGCAAFPKGLPGPIAVGDVMHWPDQPFQGDRGIRFDLNPEFIGKMTLKLENQLEAAGVLYRPDEVN